MQFTYILYRCMYHISRSNCPFNVSEIEHNIFDWLNASDDLLSSNCNAHFHNSTRLSDLKFMLALVYIPYCISICVCVCVCRPKADHVNFAWFRD